MRKIATEQIAAGRSPVARVDEHTRRRATCAAVVDRATLPRPVPSISSFSSNNSVYNGGRWTSTIRHTISKSTPKYRCTMCLERTMRSHSTSGAISRTPSGT